MKKPICFKFEQKFRNINDLQNLGKKLTSTGLASVMAGPAENRASRTCLLPVCRSVCLGSSGALRIRHLGGLRKRLGGNVDLSASTCGVYEVAFEMWI